MSVRAIPAAVVAGCLLACTAQAQITREGQVGSVAGTLQKAGQFAAVAAGPVGQAGKGAIT